MRRCRGEERDRVYPDKSGCAVCACLSCAQDEFDEESAILREWYTDLRPIGLQSLTAWLEKRRAPKRRNHMEQLLEQYGCVGLEGFLRVTHALSAASSKVRKKAPEK